MLFFVDGSSIEGETVLTLHGELDLCTQPRFMAALAGIDDRAARVVLDVSDLTFIDCGNIAIIQRVRLLAGLRGTSSLDGCALVRAGRRWESVRIELLSAHARHEAGQLHDPEQLRVRGPELNALKPSRVQAA